MNWLLHIMNNISYIDVFFSLYTVWIQWLTLHYIWDISVMCVRICGSVSSAVTSAADAMLVVMPTSTLRKRSTLTPCSWPITGSGTTLEVCDVTESKDASGIYKGIYKGYIHFHWNAWTFLVINIKSCWIKLSKYLPYIIYCWSFILKYVRLWIIIYGLLSIFTLFL